MDKNILISCRSADGTLLAVVYQPDSETLEEFATACLRNKDALPMENPGPFLAMMRKLSKED